MGVSPDAQARPVVGLFATTINFPMVFAGLVAIAALTDGNDEVALVNLWACWGVCQALLGQVGLVQGAVDRLSWRSPRVLRDLVAAGLASGAFGWLLRDSLFPGHPRWWLAMAGIGAATLLIGRMRGLLSTADDGVATVVITALENTLRSATLIVLLLAADPGGDVGLAAAIIVAPFVVSVALLARRWSSAESEKTGGTAAGPDAAGPRSVWTGVLASLPAVAGYAVVPGLTLLDRVADIDAFAIATSLLRGPLLIATFASAWLLQEIRKRPSVVGSAAGIALPVVLGLHLVVQLAFDPGLVIGLVLHGAISGAALFVSYIAVLWSIDELAADARTTAALFVALTVFAGVLVASTRVGWIHPFVALTAMATVLTAATSLAPTPKKAVA
jgi:hypothetical protein